MLRRKALLAMFAAILAVPGVAGAITPDQVLIVVNDRAPISERIGEYYRMARGIPKEHVARIQTDPTRKSIAPRSSGRSNGRSASTGARPEPTRGISTFLNRRAHVLETALRRASAPEAARALARVYAEQAKELAREQRLDEALARARRAVVVRPDEPAALYILGVIYLARKERALAEEVFRLLIHTDPDSPYAREALRWLGH